MAPDAIEARLSQIQNSVQELCRLQGQTTATVAALQTQLSQITHAQEVCRTECAAHRKSLWEKNDAQDEKIGKTREEAAGETGTNRANWKTWASIALLALGVIGQWVREALTH